MQSTEIYYIRVKTENDLQPIYGGDYLNDMVIKIDARVEQSSGTGDFGVICRYDNNNNLYMFEITQDAYFAIHKFIDGEWYPLIDFTYSDMLVNLEDATFDAACIAYLADRFNNAYKK